jgi:hypothetical protein
MTRSMRVCNPDDRLSSACEQVGQVVANYFTGVSKMVRLGSGAERTITDYYLIVCSYSHARVQVAAN